MAVRNWWIEVEIDGSVRRFESGPRSKDGGFRIKILARDQGSPVRVMEVEGLARQGKLRTVAALTDGSNALISKETTR